MKIPHKNKEKKEKVKKKDKIKPKKEQVLVVAQEIKFARLLSGNEKKSRDKVLKTLKKWLLNCFDKKYEFKEDDFVRMWKGLFYAVWMSDKPLIQEELCENISGVLDLFPPEQLKHALLMYKAGLRVLATEWYGVDHHRMDKFLMLVRRYLRASLRCLLRSKWSVNSCQLYANMISGTDGILSLKTPKYARNATSMLLHIIDCYLEEIAKVSSGEIPSSSLAELLRPICSYMCSGEQPILSVAARRLLTALVRQSEAGLRYRDKARAWQEMGCPEGGPDALELVSEDEDDGQNGEVSGDDDDRSARPLDPRAGRVDVELPLLPVPASMLADMLRDMLAQANSKAHKRVRICLQRFEQLARDEYPLTIKAEEVPTPTRDVKPKKIAHTLHVLEKKLVTASDELALRGLSRKHRKRLLAKCRAGANIVDELDTARKNANATNGAWKVEAAEPTEDNKTKEDDNKKNIKKRKSEEKIARLHKRQKVVHSNGDVADKRPTRDIKQVDEKIEKVTPNKNKISKNNNNNEKINKIKDNVVKNNKKNIDNKLITEKVTKTAVKNIVNGKNNSNTVKNNSNTGKNKTKLDIQVNNVKNPTVVINKVKVVKKFQKQTVKTDAVNRSFDTPKKVKFVLKNNSMQAPTDYYKSIRQSPNIPFDGTKKPSKTNLKPSTPSPINPFFKKKLKMKF